MPAIDVTNLTVEFGGRLFGAPPSRALDGLSMTVMPGEFLALIGPNGAGKSTALHCILGLLSPRSGTAVVFGRPLEPGSSSFRDVVYLPEEPHYHDYLTVEEAIQYYAALYGRRASPSELTHVLERLRLDVARRTLVSACSKGMKQKVGIAQCLLQQPRLVLLDEPMRGLDPVAASEVRDTLRSLHRSGTTIVMSSHLLSEVELLATRVAILDAGRLLALRNLDELIAPQHDLYAIEVEHLDDVPEYFTIDALVDGVLKGSIPEPQFYSFMEHARARGATIRTCGGRKRSLEESFLSVLKTGGARHA